MTTSEHATITWKDVACIGPLIAQSIYGLVSLPLSPALIGTHPLLLAALRGTLSSLISVGAFVRVGNIPLWLALLVPLPIMMASDPFLYWAGRRYGRRLVNYLKDNDPTWRRRLDRGEKFFSRYGVWTVLFANFIPAPTVFFYFAAGEAGMPFKRFIAADFLGTLAFVAALLGLGAALGQRGVTIAQTISQYGLWLTLGLIVGIVTWSTIRTMRARKA